MLAQGMIQMAKTSWVDMKNNSVINAYLIETTYDSKRAMILNFQEFYGRLNFDKFSFQSLYGTNVNFVVTVLKASIQYTDDRQYGFGYPVMRFNTDDRVDVNFTCGTLISGTSYLYGV